MPVVSSSAFGGIGGGRMPVVGTQAALFELVDEVAEILTEGAGQVRIGGSNRYLHLARVIRDLQIDLLLARVRNPE